MTPKMGGAGSVYRMANPLPRAIRGRWLAIVAQVTALEVFVLLGTAFTARYHPQSRPVDVAGYGLATLAVGAIGLSPRWPVGAVGVALGSVLVYHGVGYAPA